MPLPVHVDEHSLRIHIQERHVHNPDDPDERAVWAEYLADESLCTLADWLRRQAEAGYDHLRIECEVLNPKTRIPRRATCEVIGPSGILIVFRVEDGRTELITAYFRDKACQEPNPLNRYRAAVRDRVEFYLDREAVPEFGKLHYAYHESIIVERPVKEKGTITEVRHDVKFCHPENWAFCRQPSGWWVWNGRPRAFPGIPSMACGPIPLDPR